MKGWKRSTCLLIALQGIRELGLEDAVSQPVLAPRLGISLQYTAQPRELMFDCQGINGNCARELRCFQRHEGKSSRQPRLAMLCFGPELSLLLSSFMAKIRLNYLSNRLRLLFVETM